MLLHFTLNKLCPLVYSLVNLSTHQTVVDVALRQLFFRGWNPMPESIRMFESSSASNIAILILGFFGGF